PPKLNFTDFLPPEFQLLYAPASFAAERDSWKAVIYLNLVKSVRRILDAVAPDSPEEMLSDDSDDLKGPANNVKKQPPTLAQRSATPISFDRPTVETASPSRGSTDETYAKYSAMKMKLSPLALAEELLIRRLAGPDGEDEATQLGSWSPSATTSTSRIKEVFVRSSSNWKKTLLFQKKDDSSPEKKQDDPFALVSACKNDMIALWKDEGVRKVLKEKGLRLEELPGFYLNDIARLTSRTYTPSNQDVLGARLKTIGVVEHIFSLESGGEKGADWRIFDVGGHRDQRQTWAPFFDDCNAIIFLAPISAFDQVLVEDRRVNRIEDSLLLFRSVCANKLLAKNIVLFLNKIDILKQKLQAGIKLNRYVRSYGDRPNEFEPVSRYFLSKFTAVHKENSPVPGRELYTHLTAVTDIEATAAIIVDVREMILRKHLQDSSLM
ncbi:hypothetical protein FRB99_001807, partial [Tulasnella sp. 403]